MAVRPGGMNVAVRTPVLAPDVETLPSGCISARILLVDDDEHNLLAISQILGDVGEVVTATSGREALRLLHEEFAVILLDVDMPEMDGYEVAKLIRGREQTARIPIIFLSAGDKDDDDPMRGYAMGAAHYVCKPVAPVVLRSKVGVFVDLQTMRLQIDAKNRAEQDLRRAQFEAELDRLRTESELQASRSQLAAMVEALPLLLYEAEANAAGKLVRCFVGGDLTRIAGAQAAAFEAGVLGWEDRIHPEDRANIPAMTGAARGDTVSFEYRWICGEGTTRHFIEQCVPMPGGFGSRWAGTLIDVTEQKQLQAQLLQAGKMDAIGKLTGGVAHDFNNLLATVLGGLQLLERRAGFAPREQVIVDHMRQAAERGADMVRRMMAFARKQDLHPVSIDPCALSETVGGLVAPALGGSIAIDWMCQEPASNVLADPSQLELALVNLVLNARDAMPDGGTIRVEIGDASAEKVRLGGLPEGPYLSIQVRDEGTGIPGDLIEKISEPFFTTKEQGKGTGLGLSMAVGFVHQSGGKLTIDSQLGLGTIVEILLPATISPAMPESGRPGPQANVPLSVQRLLLVDDDEMVRTVMAEQLRELGVEVTVATDGSHALALLENQKIVFDMILTDFAMPGINGVQTIAAARNLRPDLRAAIMTGYMDDSLDRHKAPGVDVLRKPVKMDELVGILA